MPATVHHPAPAGAPSEPRATARSRPLIEGLPPAGRSPVFVRVVARFLTTAPSQRGQGTVEYALVLLGAAAVALALVAWVARSGAVGQLFDSVVGRVLRSAG